MDGSNRRWAAFLVVFLLAACQPDPSVTPAATPSTSTAVATMRPSVATSAPTRTPGPSPSPPVLPAGFDKIPWATMPSDAMTETFVVSIGVLGRGAVTTRTFDRQPTVWADGPAILIDLDGATEIVNAASGESIARYDRTALDLEGVPPDNLNYYLFGNRFATDVAHGFLYLLSGNHDGVQLRRFALDGSHETLLAKVAPDPGRDTWYADLVLTDSGTAVTTACPIDRAKVADFRCRLYLAAPGANAPLKPRFLPSGATRPCSLIASSDVWLVANSNPHCRADGGPPLIAPYMALNLKTLKTSEVQASSGLWAFGVDQDPDDGTPRLIANLATTYPFPAVYPAIGVVLRLSDPWFSMDRYVPVMENPAPAHRYTGYLWAIAGRGPGWTLLHGFGPTYAACRLGAELDAPPPDCPSGPVILETTAGPFELPSGTWGEIVPPLASPGF